MVHNAFEPNSRAINETRGINIGSRTPKPIPSTTLSTLDQAIKRLDSRTKNAWYVSAQSPYTRSIYFLSRQKCGTLRTVLARTNQSARERLLNPFGVAASASKLLVSKERFGDVVRNKSENAKAKIATGMKRAFAFAETRIKQRDKSTPFTKQFNQGSLSETTERFDVEVETETLAEETRTEQLITEIPDRDPIAAVAEPAIVTHNSKKMQQTSQQTPTECLFCEKLINCSLRTELLSEEGGTFQDIAPCRNARGP